MATYRKQRAAAPAGFFACEAAGLRWITVPDGPRVVRVLGVGDSWLDLQLLEETAPSADAARRLGQGLATLHATAAPAFGAPPDGWDGDGFFGPLDDPRPLRSGHHDRWGEHYAVDRVAQVRELLAAQDRLPDDLAAGLGRLAERLADGRYDDDLPPGRLHGDLWSGNVLWTAHGAALIDPAAHGGHPLTDLAMLHLFGLPHLADVVAAYEEARPLPHGWRDLVGLHQVYPVGMHAVLFGGGYHHQLRDLVRRYG